MVARKKRKPAKSNNHIVCYDAQGRLCLKLSTEGDQVKYIVIEILNGIEVDTTSVQSFNSRFTPQPKYPISVGCKAFLNFALELGATEEIVDALSEHIKISSAQRKHIINLRNEIPKKSSTPTNESGTIKAKPKAKKTPKPKAVGKTGKYKSAADMFRTLIIAGKLSDDKIFKLVQDEYGWASNRRAEVNRYRKKLEADGSI